MMLLHHPGYKECVLLGIEFIKYPISVQNLYQYILIADKIYIGYIIIIYGIYNGGLIGPLDGIEGLFKNNELLYLFSQERHTSPLLITPR